MSERPAIMDMTAEELRGAVRALRDLHAATSGMDAYSIRVMMQRDAAIAECILANAEEEEAEEAEEAQEGLADEVADHLAQEGSNRPMRPRVAPSAPAPDSGRFTWTAERKALLAARYPEGDHEEDLLAALNALPGIEITSGLAVHRHAVKMKLRRKKRAKKRFSAEGLANMRAAAERARLARSEKCAERRSEAPDHIADASKMVFPPAPHGVKAAPEPADGSPPDWDEQAEHDARAMFWSAKGARDLSEEFGGSLPWWQAWCERERAGQRSAA